MIRITSELGKQIREKLNNINNKFGFLDTSSNTFLNSINPLERFLAISFFISSPKNLANLSIASNSLLALIANSNS